jgi:uncharacterized protein YqeY
MSQTEDQTQTLRDRISADTKDAMKSKDRVRLSTLRLVSAAIKDRDIEARSQDRCNGIDESEILSLLSKMVKQRKDSAQTYEDAGRLELAEREREEITVIQTFLPTPLTDEEVEAAIRENMADFESPCLKDMGKIMGALKRDYAGRIDMGKAGGVVKRLLCDAAIVED